MGSVWITGDVITAARMNQKTILVDTGANINSATPYTGMMAYCTSTGSGFTSGFTYQYNGSAWIVFGVTATLQVADVYSSTIGDYTSPSSVPYATSDSAVTDFDTYFNSSSWTQVGTLITVTGGSVVGASPTSASDRRVYRSLLAALSDSSWTCEFDFKSTGINPSTGRTGFAPLCFSAGNGTPQTATQDCIVCGSHIIDGTNYKFLVFYKDGAGSYTAGTGTEIAMTDTTQYYIRIERTSTTNVKLSVFSDAGRTTHVAGSPQNFTIPSTVTGLNTVQHANDSAIGDTTYQSFVIDNFAVLSGSTGAVPALTTSNLIDGNTATKWTSASQINPYFIVDMGSALLLTAAALYWDSSSTVTQILVQTSPDASTWTTVRTINTNLLTNGAWNYFRWNLPNSALPRYVRFYGNDGSAQVLKMWEVKIKQYAGTASGALSFMQVHGHPLISSSVATTPLAA